MQTQFFIYAGFMSAVTVQVFAQLLVLQLVSPDEANTPPPPRDRLPPAIIIGII